MTSLPGHPIAFRAPKTAELIADQIRTKIVRGVLATGAALPPEGVLTAQFGVSRPTLREAFRILEAESLLVVRRGAHGGARVIAPETAVATRHVGVLLQLRGTSAVDLHVARAAVEPGCARVFARQGDSAQFAHLRSLAARVATEVSSDPWVWSGSVADFRRELLARGSSPATALLGGLLVDLDHAQMVFDATPMRAEATASACVGLAELVSRRKGQAAALHWEQHLADLTPNDVPLDTLLK